LYLSVFYRDQLNTTPTTYEIIRPDGSVYTTWDQTISASQYNASWWSWSYNSFPGSPSGAWTWAADFESEFYEKEFYLVDSCNVNLTVPTQTLNGVITYGASNTIKTDNNIVKVDSGGTMNLFAENSVTLGNSFTVAEGGSLVVKNVPVCN